MLKGIKKLTTCYIFFPCGILSHFQGNSYSSVMFSCSRSQRKMECSPNLLCKISKFVLKPDKQQCMFDQRHLPTWILKLMKQQHLKNTKRRKKKKDKPPSHPDRTRTGSCCTLCSPLTLTLKHRVKMRAHSLAGEGEAAE